MRALSIRQPYAELILRGIKTVEYRSRPTRIIGERFYIYASKAAGKAVWSRDLAMPGHALPRWMLELAEHVRMVEPGTLLPTGVIVGSAVIEKVEVVSCQLPVVSGDKRDGNSLATDNRQLATYYRWHLADVQRIRTLRKPKGHPQPVWFTPF
jgi:predicted transcriptional regulator